MTAAPTSSNPLLRPLGWAGLLVDLPSSFRLFKIEGAAKRGRVSLADDERPRLELAWNTVRSNRAGERLMRTKLKQAGDRKLVPVDNTALAPLLLDKNDDQEMDRCVGFCPATKRVIEWVYRHGPPRENELVRRAALPSLRDQPRDGPSRWAFFDVSFTAPAGFVYREAVLNLGDMRVRLVTGRDEFSGPSVVVRQLYPADLALQRQPLERWHEDWQGEFRKVYRPRRGVEAEIVSTARGAMLTTPAAARLGSRVHNWRLPATAGFCTLHDESAGRIVNIFIAHRSERLDPLIEELIAGLHWNPTSV